MAAVIDSYIHDEVHRYILKRKFIDNPSFEKLAEEVGLDDSTVKRIVKKNKKTIQEHL
jgi:AraC-like DNA-binding protein